MRTLQQILTRISKMGICNNKKSSTYSFYLRQDKYFLTRYTIFQILGKGSSGQVNLALQNKTHQKFAVKTLQKTQIIRQNLFSNVKREKQILQKISSKINACCFLIQLVQCCQDYENLYLVTEYLPRGNLRQLLQQKKILSLKKIRFFAICIIIALKHLHQLHVIHGDLKPDNILIGKDGYLKIADFSSANYYNCSQKDIKGTKGYTAPQILQEDQIKLHNNSSDLFSLGVILWEMAHGTRYANYINQGSFCPDSELTGDSSDDSTEIDSVFQNFLDQLLQQDPSQRLNIQNIWSHPWLSPCLVQLQKFMSKKLSPHPFQPLQQYYKYCLKSRRGEQVRIKKKSLSFQDLLLNSVLLNQKKYQELFAFFTKQPKK